MLISNGEYAKKLRREYINRNGYKGVHVISHDFKPKNGNPRYCALCDGYRVGINHPNEVPTNLIKQNS